MIDKVFGRKKVSLTTFIVTVVVMVVLICSVGLVGYNQLQNSKSQYNTLQNSYNSLQSQYNTLQNSYNSLQSQYKALQGNYTALLSTPGRIYDITKYGAIPDDGKDDISAFQSILSAHPSNIQIHVPRGTFLVSAAILLHHNDDITIFGEGEGSIIKAAAQNDIMKIESSRNVLIRDLVLDGNGQYSTGTSMGINAGFYADGLQIENVYVHDTAGNGIHIFASKNAIINNCKVTNAGKKGINPHACNAIILNSVDGARITNNQINGFYGDGGIDIVGFISGFPMINALVDHNTITGAHTDESSGIGVGRAGNCIITNNIIHDDQCTYDSDDIFQGIDGIFLAFDYSHIIVSNNEVYGATGVGIEINNGSDIIAIDNYVHDFQSEARNSAGFYVSAANALVANNTIEDAYHFGLLIGIGSVDDNEQIIQNTIRNTRYGGIWGIYNFTDTAGIRIIQEGADKKNLVIIDNVLINNTYGIYKTGSGQLINLIMTGNSIIGSKVPYEFHNV
jgi:hypothetical protein